MRSVQLLLLLLTAIFPNIIIVVYPQTCSHNLEYSDCGSHCPLTCDNYNDPPICILLCAVGCFCPTGTVIGPSGNCILPSHCCQPNSNYTDCGSSCPDTCENFLDERLCTLQCVSGCFCNTGYALYNNTCIDRTDCPNTGQCGANKMYKYGGICRRTCSDIRKYRNVFCPEIVRQGCYCINDSLVIADDGVTCQTEEECLSVPCAPNMNQRYGGICDRTCSDLVTYYNKPCPAIAILGCFCDDITQVISADGETCQSREECLETFDCGSNMHYVTCGTACPKTCDNYNMPIACTKQCVQGCVCNEGYVKLGDNCVSQTECPIATLCSENMHFESCGSNCAPLCENTDSEDNITCIQSCQSGCYCDDEYIMRRGFCIGTGDCSLLLSQSSGAIVNSYSWILKLEIFLLCLTLTMML